MSDSTDSGSCFDDRLRQARQGDRHSLGEILQSYRKYLIFLARSGLHHHMQGKADPADVVQEVCLAASDSFEDFRGNSTEEFASWLRGILSNVLAMQVRRYLGTQKRDPRIEQALNQGLLSASSFLHSNLAGDFTSPSQHFARNEAFLRMAEALETLPKHYRQVIVLRHVDNLSFNEVAQQMDRSVDSVEKLWVRALAQLKQSIGDE
ncbi:sigma-70 family RNA polymerase sigma factor [Rubripirellula tenax]|nr:sigma-70 family RNA polymerase sigma factor [Rubripirellula tenax]